MSAAHVWEAVFPLLNDFARIPVCGLIAQYNATPPFPGPDRLPVVMREVLSRSLHIRGFIQREFADQRPAFYKEMGQWIREGRVKYREDVIEGLERAPEGLHRPAAGEQFRQAGRQGAIASRPGFGGKAMPRDSRLVLIACYLAIFAIGENSTAIMAALPAMSRGLGLAPAVVEWTVNAYLLAAAAFIILGGRAADGFGPRRSSAAGIALFALASLLIALAPNGPVLVAARTLQGLGAAFAVAGTLAAVTQSVPEAGRPGAIGTWTGFLMLGFSIGPLLGGAVTHYAGWRINFWLNLLVMLPAALALWRSSRSEPRRPNPVDGARAPLSRRLHGDAHHGIARFVDSRCRALACRHSPRSWPLPPSPRCIGRRRAAIGRSSTSPCSRTGISRWPACWPSFSCSTSWPCFSTTTSSPNRRPGSP